MGKTHQRKIKIGLNDAIVILFVYLCTRKSKDDKLEVNVIAINAPSSSWPQVFISYVDADGKWLNFPDTDNHSDVLRLMTKDGHVVIVKGSLNYNIAGQRLQ